MPKVDLVIRTSLGNKRVVLRGNSSNPPTEQSSLNSLPQRGSSLSHRKMKKNYKRRLTEVNKQLKISHEDGVLKASFQGDSSVSIIL